MSSAVEFSEFIKEEQFPKWKRSQLIDWLNGSIENWSVISDETRLDVDNIDIEEDCKQLTQELKEKIILHGSMVRAYKTCLGYIKSLTDLD